MIKKREVRSGQGFEVQFYDEYGKASTVMACDNEDEVAKVLSDYCWRAVKGNFPTVWLNGNKWRPEIKVKENNMTTTLTEFLSKVSVSELYDNICIALHGAKAQKYDCTKILVGKKIFDAVNNYYEEQGVDAVGFGMIWCCYGPIAELENYDVRVEEGWCTF